MTRIKSTVYLMAIVAVGFAACSDDESGSDLTDSGLPNGTGGQGGSLGGTGGARLDGSAPLDSQNDRQADSPLVVDGKPDSSEKKDAGDYDAPVLDAPVEGATCSGPNPASVSCRKSIGDCVPSACFCSHEGGWVCTADCRMDPPICVDGGIVDGDAGESGLGDAGKGVACGNRFCADGTYCCNASCGICAPQGGGCIALACDPPKTWACANDNDCKLQSDYCDGCNCLAVGPGGIAPTCKGTTVQCVSDPCSLKVSRCLNGQCVATSKTN